MKRKRLLTVAAVIIVVLFMIDVFAGNYLYNMVIKRGPKDFLAGNEDLEVSAETMDVFLAGDWRDWMREQRFERIEMKSFDGLTLQGYYLPAEEETDRTVFFVHGYLGNAFDMGLYGEYYYKELGYNLFIPDLRGHGESEGDYIGFGWDDRLDIVDWLDVVVAEVGEEADIVLHGLSMGAAAVLMASGEELPKQVKGIIADSPYTSVYDMFAYQMERMYHVPAFTVLPVMSVVTNVRAGYSLREASALQQVKKAEVPILYIHGAADTFVPYTMSEELADVTKSAHELVIFPDANHGESIVLHEWEYYDVVRSFLAKIMPDVE